MNLHKLLKYVNRLLKRKNLFGVGDENTISTPQTPAFRSKSEIHSPQQPQDGGTFNICDMTIKTFWYVSSRATKGSSIKTPNGKIIAPPEYKGEYHLNSKIIEPYHDPNIYTILESSPFQLITYTDENGIKKQIYSAVDTSLPENELLYKAWLLTIYVSLCKRLTYDMDNYVLPNNKSMSGSHIGAYSIPLQYLTEEWVPECIKNYDAKEYYELFEISFIAEMYQHFENRQWETAKTRWFEYLNNKPKHSPHQQSPAKPSPPAKPSRPRGRAVRGLFDNPDPLRDLTNKMENVKF